jgi:hypothetical protein
MYIAGAVFCKRIFGVTKIVFGKEGGVWKLPVFAGISYRKGSTRSQLKKRQEGELQEGAERSGICEMNSI